MNVYLKTYREIQREKAVERLKRNLQIVAGILVGLVLLGLVGRVAG